MGFDPNQPRDGEGQWTKAGKFRPSAALMRAITSAESAVTSQDRMGESVEVKPGMTLDQYAPNARTGELGKRAIRRVVVLSVTGSRARVRALNGPLAGTEYEIAADVLRPVLAR
jgi:hypothetical protein